MKKQVGVLIFEIDFWNFKQMKIFEVERKGNFWQNSKKWGKSRFLMKKLLSKKQVLKNIFSDENPAILKAKIFWSLEEGTNNYLKISLEEFEMMLLAKKWAKEKMQFLWIVRKNYFNQQTEKISFLFSSKKNPKNWNFPELKCWLWQMVFRKASKKISLEIFKANQIPLIYNLFLYNSKASAIIWWSLTQKTHSPIPQPN